MDFEPAGPPFFDDEGRFLSPVHAATHAIVVQGGYADPITEAYRMISAGGVLAERARAWFAENPPANPCAEVPSEPLGPGEHRPTG